MKTMKIPLIAAMLLVLPHSVAAQLVTAPDVEKHTFCPNRPNDPAVLENMDTKEAHRAILLQRMYRASSFSSIVTTGDCSCGNRFPAWEPVVEYYLKNYASLDDRHEVYAATDPYEEIIRSSRTKTRELCVAQGNWN